jgi:hypothetical protein
MSAALGCLANIGNIRGPVQNWSGSKRRAAQLRATLSVSDTSLLALHVVRIGFAHFDERLDWCGKEAAPGFLVDHHIGPANGIGGYPPPIYARRFEPTTNTASVFSASLNLQAAPDEVAELYQCVQGWEMQQGRWGG